jgi:hypothetical protein
MVTDDALVLATSSHWLGGVSRCVVRTTLYEQLQEECVVAGPWRLYHYY